MTTEQTEFGRIGLWTSSLDSVSSAEAQEFAGEIEALGYGAIWLPEVAGRDVMVHLALLLSATRTLTGATGIANIWARDAVAMSAAAHSLAEAFPRRILVGLGVSSAAMVTKVRGHSSYSRPYSRMADYLDTLEKAPFTAVAAEYPPEFVLGALGPRMLRLAAARTRGAHTYFCTPENTAWARETLGPDALLCVEQAVVLDGDTERARAAARTHAKPYLRVPAYRDLLGRAGLSEADFADGGSVRLLDRVVAWGDEEAIVARVRDHLDAGADHVCIQPLPRSRGEVPADQWRLLAPAVTTLR
ncbi:MAG TPA: TIGR03620 family F420-dependent LLM class oxidoreductase [Amycolatopsis sp.]|nr:TIGR03620 family F420-dependent LLM class oxidoreductase [Amycolatopsis sp.]